jgi:hypothetical protein
MDSMIPIPRVMLQWTADDDKRTARGHAQAPQSARTPADEKVELNTRSLCATGTDALGVQHAVHTFNNSDMEY